MHGMVLYCAVRRPDCEVLAYVRCFYIKSYVKEYIYKNTKNTSTLVHPSRARGENTNERSSIDSKNTQIPTVQHSWNTGHKLHGHALENAARIYGKIKKVDTKGH